MQLYPLCYGGVHALRRKIRDFFNSDDGANRQLMVKAVEHGNALDFDKSSLFQGALQLLNGHHGDGEALLLHDLLAGQGVPVLLEGLDQGVHHPAELDIVGAGDILQLLAEYLENIVQLLIAAQGQLVLLQQLQIVLIVVEAVLIAVKQAALPAVVEIGPGVLVI